MKLKRISQHEFDRIVAETGLTERTASMACSVLVHGRTQPDVAEEYGMTKQRVGLAVRVIEKRYFEVPGPADSVVSVDLDLPLLLAAELAALRDAIQDCKSGTKAARTINQVLEYVIEKRRQLEE